jgi:hypothetical protein
MGEINNLRNLLTPAEGTMAAARAGIGGALSRPWQRGGADVLSRRRTRVGARGQLTMDAHWLPFTAALGARLQRWHIRHRADRLFDSSRRGAFRLLHGCAVAIGCAPCAAIRPSPGWPCAPSLCLPSVDATGLCRARSPWRRRRAPHLQEQTVSPPRSLTP